ncbi:MAG: PIN domain nuclease [Acidobacteria bacterium]|nr:MAG: PIN domain nuclease [Acidobacteriota bacterium]
MIVVDVNLLLYAYNASAEHHKKARAWLEDVLSGHEPVALSWIVILAFLRLSTSRRMFPRPLSMAEATVIVSKWFERSQAVIVNPGGHHWTILQEAIFGAKAAGPLVTDAHIAAIAIENGATLYTTDRDFARFPKLKFKNPIEGS